jgi:flagellar biosynthesis protein FlhB
MFEKLKLKIRSGFNRLFSDVKAFVDLANAAIGLGIAAIATGIVAYVLGQVQTMLNNPNVTTVLNYGISAMQTLAQWLGIIALAIAIAYVLTYFRNIGRTE